MGFGFPGSRVPGRSPQRTPCIDWLFSLVRFLWGLRELPYPDHMRGERTRAASSRGLLRDSSEPRGR
eukprot:5871583-Pyramimonas_sp.AAC.1